MYTLKGDDPNRRAIQQLLDAYANLEDPARDDEVAATIKLFHLVAQVEGDEYARQWVTRLAEQIRREADGSS